MFSSYTVGRGEHFGLFYVVCVDVAETGVVVDMVDKRSEEED